MATVDARAGAGLRAVCALAMVLLAETAAVPTSAQLHAAHASSPPTIDAALTDPQWSGGHVPDAVFEDLTTRRPATFSTDVSVLYDDRNLYVAFHCVQSGASIIATQTTNDVGFGDDDFVGVGIDTSGVGSQVYFFETTPRGTRYEQASESTRYKPQWSSRAFIGNGEWTAVLTIPFNAMRIHGGQQNWRINFVRSVAATGDHFSWAYTGVMQDNPIPFWPAAFDARYWPSVTGLTIVSSSSVVRPRPHAEIYGLDSIGRDRHSFAASNGIFATQPIRYDGIDATVPLTNTINFVGTLDPDYSNVEIDQQTIVPQEFVRNLQEYRPFFAQGANFIDANGSPAGSVIGQPQLIFYSPGVGVFDRGEKIEGTFGKQSFGLLNFSGSDSSFGNAFDDTAYGFRHAEGDRSFVYWIDGASVHHGFLGSDDTNEFGIASRNLGSGFIWLGNVSSEKSDSAFYQGEAHSGYGFVDEQKPNYEVNLGYQDESPNYAPLDGITPNSDIRGFDGYVAFSGTTPAIKTWYFNVVGDRLVDRSGAVHQADAIISGQLTFKNQISLYSLGTQIGELRGYDIPLGPGCTGPTIGVSFFTGFPCYRNGTTQRFELYGGAIGYKDGTPTPVDFSYATGPYGGNALKIYSLSTSRPLGSHFSMALEFDGSDENLLPAGTPNSQFLRRVSLGDSISANTNISLSFRSISGTGGFAQPGVDLAASLHQVFGNGSELFVNFGTPAASTTLDRLVVKYVLHTGGGTGT
ncbi:MAG TPA: hypothetical protein VID24_00060 [Candidatus Eremiobacteraceae bacterium]|jgi:hypothetical protein